MEVDGEVEEPMDEEANVLSDNSNTRPHPSSAGGIRSRPPKGKSRKSTKTPAQDFQFAQQQLPPDAPQRFLSAPSSCSITRTRSVHVRFENRTEDPRSPLIVLRRHKSDLHKELDYTDEVPDEVLLHVFKWLPKATLVRGARVCSRWERLCFDDVLWTRMDLAQKRISESQLHRIISRGSKFVRLARAEIEADWQERRGHSLHDIPLTAARITHLDFSMAIYNSPEVVDLVIGRCQSLVALSLEHGFINDSVCVKIARNPSLEILNMPLAVGLSAHGLKLILTHCKRLRELNLAWCVLGQEDIACLVHYIPNTVTRINVSGCRERCLNNSDIIGLIKACPLLEELDISDCVNITGGIFEPLLRNLKKLRILHLSRCYGIEPTMLTMCYGLEVLSIYGIVTDEGLALLRSKHLPKVRVNEQDHLYSTIARPTVGIRRTSIWCHRVRHE